MKLKDELLNKKIKLSVVGLGYVGLPIAIEFAKKIDVIGFDTNSNKIELYKKGYDPMEQISEEEMMDSSLYFTDDEALLKESKFHIIAVPTPVNYDHTPDLSLVINASKTVGRNLTKGSIVVYESTVYPGVTEDICVPILERESNLKCGQDFKVGYSPERINPNDNNHTITNIKKVVSGMDKESLESIAGVYELIVKAGVFRASSIKVAEAAKVIENSQRDINIAFMNELSIIFDKMGIDTKEVLEAASTKWNFVNFTPGLVGGHCIGVDPYYLTYKAEQFGYHSQVILSGRRINDDMGKYIAQKIIKNLVKAQCHIEKLKIAIFGFAFKENCKDVRNTKVIDIINELKEYGINVIVYDPVADREETEKCYGIKLSSQVELKGLDAIIVCVKHDEFTNYSVTDYDKMFGENQKVIFDVKSIYERDDFTKNGYLYWRL